ncbi:PREDICTED: uncharacterized protein LOC109225523 [Nicotiana attenuata]|uniref:Endoplasmic reticulum transmembrane protein n=1 Tax=Nicotiana attenuata TaxID=49451 RepID=A0A1J6IGC3_NICAT|nr:PREDICTED: uncharacterized protein LOC109225523 [Nicotiana attenuata]OIT03436.1 hypothetical protein A4A49_01232 [Nicotiana attenuata]
MLATYIVLFILASLILGETLVFFGIWSHISFQESIIVALSHIHKGKGPLVVRRMRILMFCVLLYWVYSTSVIFYSRWIFHGPINWRDDVALYLLILQASLLGFSLFAWMVLDKLHPVIMEHHSVRKIIKAEEILLQERKLLMEDHRSVLQGKIAELRAKMKKLETDCKMKATRAQAAGAIVLKLKNQFEELHLKYDRLLEYNQTLRNQLQSISHEVQIIDESDGWSNLKIKLGCPTLENNGQNVDFENVMEAATKYGEYLVSVTQSLSSPRHRRRIYQC